MHKTVVGIFTAAGEKFVLVETRLQPPTVENGLGIVVTLGTLLIPVSVVAVQDPIFPDTSHFRRITSLSVPEAPTPVATTEFPSNTIPYMRWFPSLEYLLVQTIFQDASTLIK